MVCLCVSPILHRGAPGHCSNFLSATEYLKIFKVNTATSARLHAIKLFGTNCLLMELSGISFSLGARQNIPEAAGHLEPRIFGTPWVWLQHVRNLIDTRQGARAQTSLLHFSCSALAPASSFELAVAEILIHHPTYGSAPEAARMPAFGAKREAGSSMTVAKA